MQRCLGSCGGGGVDCNPGSGGRGDCIDTPPQPHEGNKFALEIGVSRKQEEGWWWGQTRMGVGARDAWGALRGGVQHGGAGGSDTPLKLEGARKHFVSVDGQRAGEC